ncbi:hypothetical protein BaRGS_00023547 [Batillaria attramentaria]|uniref:Pre-mRNA splicing factor component Cdc5p/Cef1 C-terminal domain-containing protein n=1 Tax=Batillaria attramentaria TaxID=370345 RepID=A0ABD0KDY5_9CAEN
MTGLVLCLMDERSKPMSSDFPSGVMSKERFDEREMALHCLGSVKNALPCALSYREYIQYFSPLIYLTQTTLTYEAQNIVALTNVDTLLKGGLNIPLHDSDFSGVTPCPATVQTPNTVLGTPYRTPGRGEAAGMTPMPRPGTDMTASGGNTPSQTLLRDKLSINQMDEEAIVQGKFYQRQEEMRRRSLAVQRDLPHPVGINSAVLCPTGPGEPPLTELQKQLGITPGSKKPPSQKGVVNQAQHLDYLEQNPYDKFDDDDLQAARHQLKEEMQVVKEGMGHGELSIDSFSQVWKECYTQLLFLPAQNRYIRASLASKKNRIQSLEKRLEKHMTRIHAKHAAKLEKKLKILLGGYQSRAQGRIKQMTDLSDQLEHTYLEMKTFENLRQHEIGAIPKCMESLKEDVQWQMEH